MKLIPCARVVAECYDIPVNVLLGRSRVKHVAEARQIVMYVLVLHGGLGVSRAGRLIKRHHTAVAHAIKSVTDWRRIDRCFSERFDAVMARLIECGVVIDREVRDES